jgi:tetratricopeptide (TPR) repeat protein
MIPAPAARNTSAAAWAAREKLAPVAAPATDHDPHLCDDCNDQLNVAANAVFVLIDAGKFDAAEQAAHDVLARFPGVHDGYECLGRLHQAKGDHHQAVECYREVIEFARNEPHFVDHFQDLIARLEPQTAEAATD